MNLEGEDAKWFCLVCSGRESNCKVQTWSLVI